MINTIKFQRKGFIFHELMTTNLEESKKFYEQITGLTITSGPYPMLLNENQVIGGLVGPRAEGPGWPSGGPEPHWIPYFGVKDVKSITQSVKDLGGKILLPPTNIPEVGQAAVLQDPQGAPFGIFSPSV